MNDLLAESLEIYEEVSAGPVPFDLTPWPMLVLAVEDDELEAARGYAEAVGGEEVDLRADPWFADDLAGGFVVEGGWTLDAMGATTALAEAARREGVDLRLGCEAKRILVEGGRVTGLATDEGVLPCERVVLATGPWLRLLLRPLGVELPVTASRGWLLETDRVDPIPALRDRAGALADAGRDGERRRRADGARGRGGRRRRAGRRFPASRRAPGWSLPHRHVAPALAAWTTRKGRRPFGGWPSAPPASRLRSRTFP